MITKTNLEAVVDSYSDEIRQLGGIALTRIHQDIDELSTSVLVESTLAFPESGFFKLDNEIIEYTGKSANSFVGLVRGSNFTNKSSHSVGAIIQDHSKSNNAIDRARREFLVNYATGEALNVLGRNLGITRYFIGLTDEQFREVIKNVSYAPLLTVYAFERVLDAILEPDVITDGATFAVEPTKIYGTFDPTKLKIGLPVFVDGDTTIYKITAFDTIGTYIEVCNYDNPSLTPTFTDEDGVTVTVRQFILTEYPNGKASKISINAHYYSEDPLQEYSFITTAGDTYLFNGTNNYANNYQYAFYLQDKNAVVKYYIDLVKKSGCVVEFI